VVLFFICALVYAYSCSFLLCKFIPSLSFPSSSVLQWHLLNVSVWLVLKTCNFMPVVHQCTVEVTVSQFIDFWSNAVFLYHTSQEHFLLITAIDSWSVNSVIVIMWSIRFPGQESLFSLVVLARWYSNMCTSSLCSQFFVQIVRIMLGRATIKVWTKRSCSCLYKRKKRLS